MSEKKFDDHARVLSDANGAVVEIIQRLIHNCVAYHSSIEGLYYEFEKWRRGLKALHDCLKALHDLIEGYEELIDIIEGYEELIDNIIPEKDLID